VGLSTTHTCGALPAQCYFTDQCPPSWICDTSSQCFDPNCQTLQGCDPSLPNPCEGVPTCVGGLCECINRVCTLKPCGPSNPCGLGTYCTSGVCQPAAACQEQPQCAPYSLVCVSGFCTNPVPCGPGNTCTQADYTCNTNTNPPGCFPKGSVECTDNLQCPAGKYCELFTGKCEVGCRDNSDCGVDEICRADHVCAVHHVVGPEEACEQAIDCPVDTTCALNATLMAAFCAGKPSSTWGCGRSCRWNCNVWTEPYFPKCPTDHYCWYAGDPATATVCYENLPSTAP
jgi:hypothetical protein